jgi:hypothetical protein
MKMVKELVYLGKDDYEEYYINLADKNLTGWSFMGLRPVTEDKLREIQREQTPEDFGYEIPDWMSVYFDYERWRDDIEENWLEHHDSQGEYELNCETYYLGFGSGTDIFNFFKNHKIKTYKDLVSVFTDDINITEEQFKELVKIMSLYKKDEKKGYKEFMLWQENVSEHPNEVSEWLK